MSRIGRQITHPVNKMWSGFTNHFHLRTDNENLTQQNVALLREEKRNFLEIEDSLYVKEEAFTGKKRVRLYDYTSAHVVYNSLNKTHNYLIIDKGSKEGMMVDMAVFSPQGIVGVINDVAPDFSTVMSMLHPDTRISARVMPNNQIGTVVWHENNTEIVNLRDIPQHIMVNVGDSVYTSGFSNVFPKDILIGAVVSVEEDKKSTFLDIRIELATDFNRLDQVYVVKNLYKAELDSLKSNFKHE
jgi:rod shape-determining protein MreC